MRYCGKIGFSLTTETEPGIWSPTLVEKIYYGEITRNSRQIVSGENLNDNVNVTNQFRIVADQFAYENLGYMRYITWKNSKWKIASVDIDRPRIVITLGGLYNGPESDTPENPRRDSGVS